LYGIGDATLEKVKSHVHFHLRDKKEGLY